jgi:hypothetical protein
MHYKHYMYYTVIYPTCIISMIEKAFRKAFRNQIATGSTTVCHMKTSLQLHLRCGGYCEAVCVMSMMLTCQRAINKQQGKCTPSRGFSDTTGVTTMATTYLAILLPKIRDNDKQASEQMLTNGATCAALLGLKGVR